MTTRSSLMKRAALAMGLTLAGLPIMLLLASLAATVWATVALPPPLTPAVTVRSTFSFPVHP